MTNMASLHFVMKNGKCGTGGSHAQYITREGKYSRGEKAEELIHKEHGNMPSWAQDNPQDFWKAADQNERANGRVYTELEIDLPNELTQEQRTQLVQEFVREQIGENHAYTFAIHEKDATLDPSQKNPHAHIMFSERKNDGIERSRDQYFKRANSKNPEKGGAAKDRDTWHGRDKVYELRQAWAEKQNQALEREGHSVRVDPRTLEEQRAEALERGDKLKADLLDRPAEWHLGPKANNPEHQEVVKLKEFRQIVQEKNALVREIHEQAQTPKEKIVIEPTTVKEFDRAVQNYCSEINSQELALAKQLDYCDRLKKDIALPHRSDAIDEFIKQDFGPKWQEFKKHAADYNQRLEAHNNAGFFAKMKGGYDENAKQLQRDYQRLSSKEKELKTWETSTRQELSYPDNNRARGAAEVERISQRLAQERDPNYGAKVASIEEQRKQIFAERKALEPDRKIANELRRSLGKVPQQRREEEIKVPVSNDGQGRRLSISQTMKQPDCRQQFTQMLNQLSKELDKTYSRSMGMNLGRDMER